MERWQNRVAVVTGASSGIGAACARLIVAAGVQVVGLARRTDRMEALRESLPAEQRARFHFRQCDVSQAEQVHAAFAWIEAQLGGCDVLVNNAGIVREGNLVEMALADVRDIIDTNLMGPIYCTQEAFRSMRARASDGHLIFINSTAGLASHNPGEAETSLNAYMPSKCALNAVNEICRQELITLKTRVKTTNISPGWVSTEIVPEATKAQLGAVILQAEDVAQAVLYALSTPPHVQVQEVTLRSLGEWY